MSKVNILQKNYKIIMLLLLILCFIIYARKEGKYNDPYNRIIKEKGLSVTGEVTNVERWKVGLAIWITYTIDGKKYSVCERYYDENLHTKFLKCSYDSTCIGEKYIVKYLPERPEKSAVCFDKPIQNVMDKK